MIIYTHILYVNITSPELGSCTQIQLSLLGHLIFSGRSLVCYISQGLL